MKYLRKSLIKPEEKGGYFIQEKVELASYKSLDIVAENQEILNEVANLETDKENRKLLIARVFEHSTTDGLKLMEKNQYTNKDYLEILKSPKFYLKHKNLGEKIISEAKYLTQNETDKKEIAELNKAYERYEQDLVAGNDKVFLKKENLTDIKAKELLIKIDGWYEQFLKTKNLIPSSIETDPRSRGEKLGEKSLEQIQLALEKNYYSGDVMQLLVKYLGQADEKKITQQAQDIFENNELMQEKYKFKGFTDYLENVKKGKDSVREVALENLREILSEDEMRGIEFGAYLTENIINKIIAKYSITDQKTLKQLEQARYKPLDITFKIQTQETEKELIKEINTEGNKVIWDKKLNQFITEGVGIEQVETRFLTEEKIITELERYLKEGADKVSVVHGLAGCDSPQAWTMRERLLKEGVDKGVAAIGLAGCDSPQAWTMRERLLKEGMQNDFVVKSLAGLDSPQAWAMREQVLKENMDNEDVARGLAGCDSPQAWATRERLLKEKYNSPVAESLAGCDSPQAWAMREHLLMAGVDNSYVAMGLTGLDSPQAWAMRERLLKEGVYKGSVAESLAGCDSPQAWAMRERLLKEGKNDDANDYYIALGLGGLDSPQARAMRERVFHDKNKGFRAEGLVGNCLTFGWQLKYKENNLIQNKDAARKLKLLNILNILVPISLEQEELKKSESVEIETKYFTEENVEKLIRISPRGKFAFLTLDLEKQKERINYDIKNDQLNNVRDRLSLIIGKDINFSKNILEDVLKNPKREYARDVVFIITEELIKFDKEYATKIVNIIDKDNVNFDKKYYKNEILKLRVLLGDLSQAGQELEEQLKSGKVEMRDDVVFAVLANDPHYKKYIDHANSKKVEIINTFQKVISGEITLGYFDDVQSYCKSNKLLIKKYFVILKEAVEKYLSGSFDSGFPFKSDEEVIDNLATRLYSLQLEQASEHEQKYKPEQQEGKFLTEEKILTELERLLKEGVSKDSVATGLAGCDSPQAWAMREHLVENDDLDKDKADKSYVVLGLAGCDSPRAWAMRERYLLMAGVDNNCLALSLAGCDSSQAWAMRELLLKKGADKGYVVLGLVGCDSPQAWAMRERLLKEVYRFVEKSLAGLDSPQAWAMRERYLLMAGVDNSCVAKGLAGCDSPRAWAMRERLLKEGVYKGSVAESLAGCDSPQAWAMRELLLEEGVDNDCVALGLAGCDSPQAWTIRERLLKESIKKSSVVKSLAGNYITFVWQLKHNLQKENKIKQNIITVPTQEFDEKKLAIDIQNYLTQDSLLAPKRNRSVKEKIREGVQQSKSFAKTVTEIIKQAPGIFIDTLAAKKDSRQTARKLANKAFPNILWSKPEKDWRDYSGYSGYDSSDDKFDEPEAEDYLSPQSMEMMLGGNPESLAEGKEDKEVMRFREPINDLVVTGIYGKMTGNTWDSSYQFPVDNKLMEKARDITIALPKIGRQTKLPKLLSTEIITERVKGIKKGEEIALSVDISPMREGLVNDTKKCQELVYSIEIDEVPSAMREISQDEYSKFKDKFIRDNGREASATIAELPEEIDLFLEQIKTKNPKEQVQLIEQFVRLISYYDMKNGEMIGLKKNKSLEERLEIMQARVDELREKDDKNKDVLQNKMYAGVCADFAVLGAAILRRAGFVSGVLSGFMPEGKSAKVSNAHGTAFVVWPNSRGGNEIFAVDGTPQGLEGISRLSLAELEKVREEKIVEIKKEASEKLDEIIKVLASHDEESIKKLTNGELENVLNVVLRYNVKQENLQAINGVLQAYWYSPVHKLDLADVDDKIKFLNFFESEIKSARQSNFEPAIDPGSKLFETVEEFAQRFAKGESIQQGLDILDNISLLVGNKLSEPERKALAVVTTYLRATKMKGNLE